LAVKTVQAISNYNLILTFENDEIRCHNAHLDPEFLYKHSVEINK
jgi:hypothetical protein